MNKIIGTAAVFTGYVRFLVAFLLLALVAVGSGAVAGAPQLRTAVWLSATAARRRAATTT